ncbi:MAG: threonine ammonia-lyase [Deltaproteobacteria bacterium]|nr:MAG: threonine ammonia-lyase [Deltaproteobacteria bacterium]
MIPLEAIVQARRVIRDAINVSPLEFSEKLSRTTGLSVYLKLENLHVTGSFKERGALCRLLRLSEGERRRGVITASAGNHAQGVAYHARRLGIQAKIVMPKGTPLIKVTSTRELGGEVILHGDTYDDAYEEARRICTAEKRCFIHPFDDEDVIAGQGTIGLEVLDQLPDVAAIVVPIGGGGLISGVAIAAKESNPKIRIYGVQAQRYPSMLRSIEANRILTLPAAHTIADGIAVKRVGEKTFPIVQRYVDEIVTVSEEEIANAILTLLEREKCVVEGAGATPVAALLHGKLRPRERSVALILSGGNIDVNVISRVIERGLVKAGRLACLIVSLPDRPGALHQLAGLFAQADANILQIHHDRTFATLETAEVEVTLETRGPEQIETILALLHEHGYAVHRKIEPADAQE